MVLPRAKLVMPIRMYLATKLMEKGVDPSKMRVIPHGIKLNHFQDKKAEDLFQIYGIPPEKKLISFVGRLAMENYVDDII